MNFQQRQYHCLTNLISKELSLSSQQVCTKRKKKEEEKNSHPRFCINICYTRNKIRAWMFLWYEVCDTVVLVPRQQSDSYFSVWFGMFISPFSVCIWWPVWACWGASVPRVGRPDPFGRDWEESPAQSTTACGQAKQWRTFDTEPAAPTNIEQHDCVRFFLTIVF